MSKYLVPEEGLKAAVEAMKGPSGPKFRSTEEWASCGIEAFIRWQSENPIVPSEDEQLPPLSYKTDSSEWIGKDADHEREKSYREGLCMCLAEWQRRMYLVPEPEVPEAVKGLQGIHLASVKDQADLDRLVTTLNVEAYRLGQQSK